MKKTIITGMGIAGLNAGIFAKKNGLESIESVSSFKSKPHDLCLWFSTYPKSHKTLEITMITTLLNTQITLP
ncbi:hypothetical protein SDC9_148825 [bioreactor metagenome]|uniref:Uncharacterized protein n=1 Tax=bioreactor metagenome TaxID=1076179 RepID=A0A645EHY3_9ZZZZ